MKEDMMFRIAMERCITGWHDEAIGEEQQHLKCKNIEQLSIIHQNLRTMRQVAGV